MGRQSEMESALCEDVPINKLECEDSFQLLSKEEKLYAHYLSKASWAACPIVSIQTSPESISILRMIVSLFSNSSFDSIKEKSEKLVSTEDWDFFTQYVANFLGNMGNYLSFGDSKFLPRIPKEKMKMIIECGENPQAMELFLSIADKMYSWEEGERVLNIPPNGISTYYSENITLGDIEMAKRFMESQNINAYNTRLFKQDDTHFELRLASSQQFDAKTH